MQALYNNGMSILSKYIWRIRALNSVDQAKRAHASGDLISAIRILESAYNIHPSNIIATEITKLIGTSSAYADIDIAMNAWFDTNYYLKTYPDVRNSRIDAKIHYLLHGWKERRKPSAFFDDAFYRMRNTEVTADMFALAHFTNSAKDNSGLGNPISDEFWFIPYAPTEEQWSVVPPAKMTEHTEAVVVIPVYKGYDETMSSIYNAVAFRGCDKYSVLVLNDNSPDDALNTRLHSLAGKGLFDYERFALNRGFVQTCNYAISSKSANLDIVLLNSDAYVCPGWFKRLRAHALAPSVATVTPLSNNATICSYPSTNSDNSLSLECSPMALDGIAAASNAGLAVETPTGVGFCFYIRRHVINRIGLLDSNAFKIGYGEENDFCMRALKNGYKNLIAGDVFVFHTGSVSFSAEKDHNFSQGQKALELKHPDYMSRVREHIKADPEQYLRRRLDIGRISAALDAPIVFISHKWSGGIKTYIQTEKQRLNSLGHHYISILVHDSHCVTIDTDYGLFVPNLAFIDLRREAHLIEYFFKDVAPSLIHVNSFAGLTWDWHKQILDIIANSGFEYKYVVHDYSSFCNQYHLLRPDNVYIAEADQNERRSWTRMVDNTGSVDICDADERIKTYTEFLSGAIDVVVPSQAAKRIIEKEFPSVTFSVVPHEDHLPDLPVAQRRPYDQKLKIAIIGAIGPHKGSGILASLAIDARNRNLSIEYTLIGYSDDDQFLLSCGVEITGIYHSEDEAIDRILKLQPDLVFIPSVWPETFCYTLSLALKLRIPPVVFDIGAQGERVGSVRWGVKFPLQLLSSPEELSEALLRLDIDQLWIDRLLADEASYSGSLRDQA